MTEVPRQNQYHYTNNNTQPYGGGGYGGSYGGYEDNSRAIDRSTAEGIQKVQFETVHVETEIVEERDKEIRYLESELRGLNDIFVDVAVMIREQGKNART